MESVSKVFCRLCNGDQVNLQFSSSNREFYECAQCDLLFVNSSNFLTPDEEKKRYDYHENDPQNADYRTFLSKLKNALLPKLSVGMKGLDFGSGISDAMARLFAEEGYAMDLYDPFFGPDLLKPNKTYDFITCCEVAEHFKEPKKEIELINSLLNKTSWLGVMTTLRDDYRGDSSWWYLRDPTHVCFYTRRTFRWIGEHWGLKVEFNSGNIVLLAKTDIM